MPRGVLRFVLLLCLLLPSRPAGAEDMPPAAWTVRWVGTRQLGEFAPTARPTAEVAVVRDGSEIPLSPDATVGPGDAIRTADGTVYLTQEDGSRWRLGERTQVRWGATPAVRIGTLWVDGPSVLLSVEGFEIRCQGLVRLRWNPAAGGEVAVERGAAEVVGRDLAYERVAAGERLSFAAGRPAERQALDDGAQHDLRAAIEVPAARTPRQHARSADPVFSIRIDGGVTKAMARDWFRGGFDLRLRPIGPLWLGGGAALLGRPAEEIVAAEHVLGLQLFGGPRARFTLPRGFWLAGGLDGLVLIGETCRSRDPCSRTTTAEPGARLALAAGTFFGKGVGAELELGLGLTRQWAPATYDPSVMTSAPSAWIQLGLGLILSR